MIELQFSHELKQGSFLATGELIKPIASPMKVNKIKIKFDQNSFSTLVIKNQNLKELLCWIHQINLKVAFYLFKLC